MNIFFEEWAIHVRIINILCHSLDSQKNKRFNVRHNLYRVLYIIYNYTRFIIKILRKTKIIITKAQSMYKIIMSNDVPDDDDFIVVLV